MAISFAIDELLGTGWSGLDSTGCSFDDSGRVFPGVQRVHAEFAAAGFELSISHVAKFNCFRAEWREAGAAAVAGSAISKSQEEAAVYALAQLRRSLAAA